VRSAVGGYSMPKLLHQEGPVAAWNSKNGELAVVTPALQPRPLLIRRNVVALHFHEPPPAPWKRPWYIESIRCVLILFRCRTKLAVSLELISWKVLIKASPPQTQNNGEIAWPGAGRRAERMSIGLVRWSRSTK